MTDWFDDGYECSGGVYSSVGTTILALIAIVNTRTNQYTVLLNRVHWFLKTICIKNNTSKICDRFNCSCFAKNSRLNSLSHF